MDLRCDLGAKIHPLVSLGESQFSLTRFGGERETQKGLT